MSPFLPVMTLSVLRSLACFLTLEPFCIVPSVKLFKGVLCIVRKHCGCMNKVAPWSSEEELKYLTDIWKRNLVVTGKKEGAKTEVKVQDQGFCVIKCFLSVFARQSVRMSFVAVPETIFEWNVVLASEGSNKQTGKHLLVQQFSCPILCV